MDASLIVAGVNPAWQKTLVFDAFQTGKINRASSLECYAAGKGANFCRALNCLGGAYHGLLMQFCGGSNGRLFESALQAEGICHQSVQVAAETRCCTTCLCNGEMTEIIEPSHAISDTDIATFHCMMEKASQNAAGMAISGAPPPGTPSSLYAGVAAISRKHNLPFLVDTVVAVPEILAENPSTILKINAAELARITSKPSIREGIDYLKHQYPNLMIAITDEARAAWLCCRNDDLFRLEPPHLEKIVSPLGCGDTASAVFLEQLVESPAAPEQALATALAAASANCLLPKAGEFSRETATALLPLVHIESF